MDTELHDTVKCGMLKGRSSHSHGLGDTVLIAGFFFVKLSIRRRIVALCKVSRIAIPCEQTHEKYAIFTTFPRHTPCDMTKDDKRCFYIGIVQNYYGFVP